MTSGAKILAVDASLQGVSLALVDTAATKPVLWQGTHPQNMGAVAAVSSLAADGFAATKMTAQDLDGLAVSVGPGSFTGIKVGLAFAYGVAAAAKPALRCLGLSALEAAAGVLAADGFGGPLALFLPATRTHGYVTAVDAGGAVKAAVLADLSQPDALARLAQQGFLTPADGAAPSRVMAFGRWPLLTDLVKDSGRSLLEVAPSEVCGAAIYGMAKAAAQAWPAGFGPELPAPRYLRLSTAEERLGL